MVEIVILVRCIFGVRIEYELHEIVMVINYKVSNTKNSNEVKSFMFRIFGV